MDDVEFKQLLLNLPKLTKSQLSQVFSRISFLQGSAPQEAAESWLIEGVFLELKRRGVLANKPYSLVKKWASSKEIADIERFLLTHIGSGKLLPPQKLALGRVAARALANMLLKQTGVLSLRMVIQSLSKIPMALDRAFPGYAQAGVLGLVLNAKEAR